MHACRYVPAAQHARLTQQRELLHGYWGTWNEASLTTHLMIPFGAELRVGLCPLSAPPKASSISASSSSCDLTGTKAMVDEGRLRLGSHSYDHSYTQLYMSAHGVNVSVETAQRTRWGPLLLMVRPVGEVPSHSAALIVTMSGAGDDGGGYRMPAKVEAASGPGGGSLTVLAEGSWRRQAKIRSDQIRSDQIRSDQIGSDRIRSDQIRSDQIG